MAASTGRSSSKVLDRNAGPNRGASTITMQVVKNLFLWTSRSYVRKALEIPLALYADLVWSKRRTMEIYLNIVELGPGIFGAEAAAQHYFKRHAKELSPGQAALLVSALPNPIERNPGKPSRFVNSRARTIAGRGRAAGAYINCLAPSQAIRHQESDSRADTWTGAARYLIGDHICNPTSGIRYLEPEHGRSQAKNLAHEARLPPLRRRAEAVHLCRGQGLRANSADRITST